LPDNVIDALELPGKSSVLAVQWHPEDRLDGPDARLFEAFRDAMEPSADNADGVSEEFAGSSALRVAMRLAKVDIDFCADAERQIIVVNDLAALGNRRPVR
jgi:hypothetical protein